MLTPQEKDYVINWIVEISQKIMDLQLEIDNLGYFISDEDFLQKNTPNEISISSAVAE